MNAIAYFLASSILAFAGCEASHGIDSTLDSGKAREALLALVTASDDTLVRSTERQLRDQPAVHRGEFTCIGPWRCVLSQKVFVATWDAEPIFIEFSGHFQPGDNGEWVAIVDSVTRN